MDALSILALGVAQAGGGGGGGTSDYSDLSNKPQINNVTLSGNKSLSDLGIPSYTAGDNITINNNEISVNGLVLEKEDRFVHDAVDKIEVSGESVNLSQNVNGNYTKGLSLDPRGAINGDDQTASKLFGISPSKLWFENYNLDRTVRLEPTSDYRNLAINGVPIGGGSSSGAVRYDEAQTLSNAEFNQVMSNIGLDATRTTVQPIQKFNWTGTIGPSTTTIYTYSLTSTLPDVNTETIYEIKMTIDGVENTVQIAPSRITDTRVEFKTGIEAATANWTKGAATELRVETSRLYFSFRSSAERTITSFSISTLETTEYTPIHRGLVPLTFANGLSESNDVVSWDLSDIITANKTNNSVFIGQNVNGTVTPGSYGGVILGKVLNGTMSNANHGAIAMGYSSGGHIQASGAGSIAMGYSSGNNSWFTAPGIGAIAGGSANGARIDANGEGSIALGYSNSTYGDLATYGNGQIALGTGVQASNNSTSPVIGQVVLGRCNDYTNQSDKVLVIGNGTNNSNRSNALTVDWAGNLVCNNIPACPSTDGTYNLQVSIVNGVPTYSWVAA